VTFRQSMFSLCLFKTSFAHKQAPLVFTQQRLLNTKPKKVVSSAKPGRGSKTKKVTKIEKKINTNIEEKKKDNAKIEAKQKINTKIEEKKKVVHEDDNDLVDVEIKITDMLHMFADNEPEEKQQQIGL